MYVLTPRQSKQLMYSRFVNTRGIKGRNIPCDLHMEHLNRLCKDAVQDLGSNKTTASMSRVAKILGTLDPVLQQFDEQNDVKQPSGHHAKVTCKNDINMLTEDILNYKIMSPQHKRQAHSTFPNPKCLLHLKGKDDLLQYIHGHLPL